MHVDPQLAQPTGRTYGSRFSVADGLVLVAGGLASWLAYGMLGEQALMLPLVLAHFFLFCNVFRIRRKYEYIWAAAWVVSSGAWLFSGSFTWWGALAVQSPLTVLLIVLEMRSPEYHGILWHQLRHVRSALTRRL
jgi:hypothetical protein